jgi:putative spermidine/putrescine transport system permease protein
MTTRDQPIPQPEPSAVRRLTSWLHRHDRVRLLLLIALPVGGLAIVYFGSLLILFINAFWTKDPFTSLIVRDFTLDNFVKLATTDVYRVVTLRTVGMAALVTVTCALIAFPIAYYLARLASPRTKGILVVAVLMPLWASYLIKAYSWRIILSEDGVLNWLLEPLGLSGPGLTGEAPVWITFVYLWLPYMILPIYAGLERIPGSLLEASSDLGGHAWTTFRRVILPLAFPAVVAGSIFTFSLTLGDYIVPNTVSNVQFIGNVIQVNQAQNLPLAAAYSLVPLAIMLLYLMVARRLGAFEAL